MARPTFGRITSGVQGWDSTINNNRDILSNGPFPLYQHTGDETDLDTAFPANLHDRCILWVNNSSTGWEIYASDGTSWYPLKDFDS